MKGRRLKGKGRRRERPEGYHGTTPDKTWISDISEVEIKESK